MKILYTYEKGGGSFLYALILLLAIMICFLCYDNRGEIEIAIDRKFGGKRWILETSQWAFIVPIIFCILGGLLCITVMHRNPDTYVEATIIDNYPVGALFENYEFVEKKGDIWVLKVKEGKEVVSNDAGEDR